VTLDTERPLCAEESAARGEPIAATASRVEHWLLVEYGGYWPLEPLDAAVFAGRLKEQLTAQLAALPHARLLLVKRPQRDRGERVRIFFGATPERGRWLRTLELDGHPDLLDVDVTAALRDAELGEPVGHPLLLVCTHGIRDRCCARYGQALCRELHAHADPDWLWQASHVGGDRFAGNLVCLPDGLYFGRVEPHRVRPLLGDYLAGRIDMALYRGRSCYSFAVQAAEARVREDTGLNGLDDLRLVSLRRAEPSSWTVTFAAEVAGDVHEVDVELEHGPPVHMTCRARELRSPRRFVARARRLVAPA
jgi:hypothetical protein